VTEVGVLVLVLVVVVLVLVLVAYKDIRSPPPQMSLGLPEQGMLQSLGEAMAEPPVMADPHQHSTPYSVPPYWKPWAAHDARHEETDCEDEDDAFVGRTRGDNGST